jgi:hypothetical protein
VVVFLWIFRSCRVAIFCETFALSQRICAPMERFFVCNNMWNLHLDYMERFSISQCIEIHIEIVMMTQTVLEREETKGPSRTSMSIYSISILVFFVECFCVL